MWKTKFLEHSPQNMFLICSIQKSTRLGQFSTRPAENALALASGQVLFSLADLVQDCGNSIANVLELLQPCAKPPIYIWICLHNMMQWLVGAGSLIHNQPQMSPHFSVLHSFIISHSVSLPSIPLPHPTGTASGWYPMGSRKPSPHHCLSVERSYRLARCHIDGLVQERRNSSALTMELRLSCTNPLPIDITLVITIWPWLYYIGWLQPAKSQWRSDYDFTFAIRNKQLQQ